MVIDRDVFIPLLVPDLDFGYGDRSVDAGSTKRSRDESPGIAEILSSPPRVRSRDEDPDCFGLAFNVEAICLEQPLNFAGVRS